MDEDSLNRAISCLVIKDVYLNKIIAEKSSEFDNAVAAGVQLLVNYRRNWRRVRKVEFEEPAVPEGDERLEAESITRHHLLVHYAAAFKIMDSSDVSEEGDNNEPLAEVEAEFIAEYRMTQPDIDEEAIKEFCHHNVGYHVWPYWRELARSTASRMKLPEVEIPFYRVPKHARKAEEHLNQGNKSV